MKRIFILVFSTIALFSSAASQAQSFNMWKDTVYYNYVAGSGSHNVVDSVVVPGTLSGASVTLRWAVINSNIPSDWITGGAIGICDNNNCITFTDLWPSGSNRTSLGYAAHTTNGDYHLQISLPTGATTGTYYITAKLVNATTGADSTTATWAITYSPLSVPGVGKTSTDISLYPNPANSEINVVYDANDDVKTIAVYNIIGKVMSVYRVTGNSANLNLENIPTGIYFVRLMNTQGDVVATRKFTKQ